MTQLKFEDNVKSKLQFDDNTRGSMSSQDVSKQLGAQDVIMVPKDTNLLCHRYMQSKIGD